MTTEKTISEQLDEQIEKLRKEIEESRPKRKSIDEQIEELRKQINDSRPKRKSIGERKICIPIEQVVKELKEINEHHKPRCDSMEEFLENEVMKEQATMSFYEDQRIKHCKKKDIIEELLYDWRNSNIDVDTIRKELKDL